MSVSVLVGQGRGGKVHLSKAPQTAPGLLGFTAARTQRALSMCGLHQHGVCPWGFTFRVSYSEHDHHHHHHHHHHHLCCCTHEAVLQHSRPPPRSSIQQQQQQLTCRVGSNARPQHTYASSITVRSSRAPNSSSSAIMSAVALGVPQPCMRRCSSSATVPLPYAEPACSKRA